MRRRTPHVAVCLLGVLLLAACSTTEALNPAAIQPADPVTSLAPAGPVGGLAAVISPPPAAGLAPQAPPVIPAGVRVQFAPVVGTTLDAALPLSQRLSVRAAETGLVITAGGAAPPTHLLKGYFSAFGEGKETVVVFVWDLLGPQGNRLHRIQGQERIPATAADAWSAVPPAAMEAIADRTIAEVAAWLASSRG